MMRNEEWRAQAACAGASTEVFYPPRDALVYPVMAAVARRMCLGDGGPPCPVRVECLAYALSTNERHGIWGGLSSRERTAMFRRIRPVAEFDGSSIRYLKEAVSAQTG